MAAAKMTSAITAEENLILSMVYGAHHTRCLSLIVGLKIPDLLCTEPSLSIEDIATRSGCKSSVHLYPIMKALAQWGIGQELENKHFAKNRAMELLRRDDGPSLGHYVEYNCSDELFSALIHLPKYVKQGEPAPFLRQHGMSTFEYMNNVENYSEEKRFEGTSKYAVGSGERRREFAENYLSDTQVYGHLQILPNVQGINNVYEAFPWSTCKKVVDVGGCSGEFIASIMKQPGCDHIQGYVVDLPHTVDGALKNIAKLGIPENRIEFIKHDFTKPFPASHLKLAVDTIIIKNAMCFFTGDIEKMTQVLLNCRALFQKDGGRLVVIESCFSDFGENVGVNGIQIGFESVHLQNICGKSLLSKNDWVEALKEASVKSGYQFQRFLNTFPGGVTIFELSSV